MMHKALDSLGRTHAHQLFPEEQTIATRKVMSTVIGKKCEMYHIFKSE
jgi:hypothetical protein